jgi:hypothetical protein
MAAQGAGLRALRTIVFGVDRARAFGDLRRVTAAAGDLLWVCTKHYSYDDPGLPTVP